MSPTASSSRSFPAARSRRRSSSCCGSVVWTRSPRAIRQSLRSDTRHPSRSPAPARALRGGGEFFLPDEPHSNLDANLREEMRFEIRRLHEEFRITTVYVTHDQAEAMVTSDRIAVMHQGRIVQLGAPEEIFDRPRTRFVAEFIGKTNILRGTLESGCSVSLGDGLKLQVLAADNLAPGKEVFVCLRPHSVRLTPSAEEAEAGRAKGMNLFDGVVQRRVYFGDANDYIVELPAQRLNLRVVAPPTQRYEAGQKVFALADPQQCVLVGEE